MKQLSLNEMQGIQGGGSYGWCYFTPFLGAIAIGTVNPTLVNMTVKLAKDCWDN